MTGTSQRATQQSPAQATGHAPGRAARTLLEQLIRQRRQTLEEFADYAETFAREHNEPGTLSVRHLKRLAAGQGSDGKPVSRPRQVTTRLLERIFNVGIEELLSPPEVDESNENELQARLRASERIDTTTLELFTAQLNNTRRLDREFGAPLAHAEVRSRIEQVTQLLHYSLTPQRRQGLAEHLAELCALAGWQALDMGKLKTAWLYHERGRTAATESDNPEFLAHTNAESAFVLLDLGESSSANELLQTVRTTHAPRTGPRMQAWLAAAHGETLAANQQRTASLKAFDTAAALIPHTSAESDGAYVALDTVHLARWRGHALARLGEPYAIDVLSSALQELNPTFARAEASLRIDLATAHTTARSRDEARQQLEAAQALTTAIGSARQASRIARVRQHIDSL